MKQGLERPPFGDALDLFSHLEAAGHQKVVAALPVERSGHVTSPTENVRVSRSLLDRLPRSTDQLVLAVILLVHVGATMKFFPPLQVLNPDPLHVVDHPVHAYRIHLYRAGLSESGLPWGYDPAIAAGAVSNPGQDLGAKPQQVLGVLLPFMSPGSVEKLFLFLAMLTLPIWTLLACRHFALPTDRQVWIMLVLIAMVWLAPRSLNLWRWGLVSFAYSTYFSIYVLALFLRLLDRPDVRTYVLLCIASAFLFLLHIVGPLIIIPAMASLLLFARKVDRKWRLALWSVPLFVLALNAFWVIPAFFAQNIPQPAGVLRAYPPDATTHLRFDEWTELWATLSHPANGGLLVPGLGLSVAGIIALWNSGNRRLAFSIGLTFTFALLVWLFGSFLPVVVKMQPGRFRLAAFSFMVIPIGTALAASVSWLRLPVSGSAAVVGCIMALVLIATNRPISLTIPPSTDPLTEFIRLRTTPQDRLLIQSPDGYRGGGYETKTFPLRLKREVLGSNYPAVWDPPQFLRTMLLGRTLDAWSSAELREALARWGVTWVFTYTSDAEILLTSTLGISGEPVGEYHAFRVPYPASRFLVGEGQVSARINRMDLSRLRSEGGLVVLRYRYHPGWRSTANIPIYRYAVAEDGAGFIALKNPPGTVTLLFDPWRMLRAPWPDHEITVDQVNALKTGG